MSAMTVYDCSRNRLGVSVCQWMSMTNSELQWNTVVGMFMSQSSVSGSGFHWMLYIVSESEDVSRCEWLSVDNIKFILLVDVS